MLTIGQATYIGVNKGVSAKTGKDWHRISFFEPDKYRLHSLFMNEAMFKKINALGLEQGDLIELTLDQTFNGRTYTDIIDVAPIEV